MQVDTPMCETTLSNVIEGLTSSLIDTAKNIAELEQRISPVLLPDISKPENPNKNAPSSTPLLNSLAEICGLRNKIDDKITDLIRRAKV